MSKSNASLRGSLGRSNAMRRATSACRRRMRARVQNRCRRGFPVWCCGMSSAGGCPGASLAAGSKTEPAKAPVSVRMCSQHPANALARGSPESMNCLYRSSDLAKSSPVPTVSTRCSPPSQEELNHPKASEARNRELNSSNNGGCEANVGMPRASIGVCLSGSSSSRKRSTTRTSTIC